MLRLQADISPRSTDWAKVSPILSAVLLVDTTKLVVTGIIVFSALLGLALSYGKHDPVGFEHFRESLSQPTGVGDRQ
jgi:hypothetical protein